MKIIILACVAIFAGCTAVPAVKTTPMDASKCRAVEGAPHKQTRDGRKAYKYICDGQGVWAVPQ